VLESFPEASSEYQIYLERRNGLDHMSVRVERKPGVSEGNDENLANAIRDEIKKFILVRANVEILKPGFLPRSFAKTKRVFDERS